MLRFDKSKYRSSARNLKEMAQKCHYRLQSIKKIKIQFCECSICLDSIIARDKYYLPCSHAYHTKCIEKWLCKKIICPICKIPVYIQTDDQYIEYSKFMADQRRYIDLTRENTPLDDHNIALLYIKQCPNSRTTDGLDLKYIKSAKVRDMMDVLTDLTMQYSDYI